MRVIFAAYSRRFGWLLTVVGVLVAINARSMAQWAQFERMAAPPYSRADVDELLLQIDADDRQAEAFVSLFDDYITRRAARRAEMKSAADDRNKKLAEFKSGAARGEIDDEALHDESIRDLREDSRSADALAAMDRQFAVDLMSELHDHQMASWTEYQLDRNWLLLQRSYSIVPGMSVRLSTAIRELDLTEDQRSRMEPLMREYEEVTAPVVTSALDAMVHRARNRWREFDRRHRMTQGTASTLEEVEAVERKRFQQDWEDRRAELAPQVRLRELNAAFALRASELLPEAAARQLLVRVQRDGNPYIFNRTRVHKAMDKWGSIATSSRELTQFLETSFVSFSEQLDLVDSARLDLQERAFEALWNRPYDWETQKRLKASMAELDQRRSTLIEKAYETIDERMRLEMIPVAAASQPATTRAADH